MLLGSLMLYKVEIENFCSICDHQVVDLRARKSVDNMLGRLSPIYPGSTDRVPNVVTLFGSNAAGKSNVLRAITFIAWFVSDSFKLGFEQNLPYEKFGSKEKINDKTSLSLSFSGPVDFWELSNKGAYCPYTYELVLSPRSNRADFVVTEKLSYQPNGRGKPRTIFERFKDGKIKSMSGFLSGGMEKALKEVLLPQVSVISTLAKLNHKSALRFADVAKSVISNIFVERKRDDEQSMVRWYLNNPDALDELATIARRIDLGIEKISIDSHSERPQLYFEHSGLDQIIYLHRESHGTREFIKLFPYLIMALKKGGIALIDEMDTAIHPLLLPEILSWFCDKKRNPNGAQIWATCHSASLLSELTKEEVLFCEKDKKGCTSVYKLADIENVRRNENFFGKYLGGEYGAVPVFG